MRYLSRALAVVGVALLVIGAVSGVVHREVLDADRFAAHVEAVRTDDAVSRELGVLVADQIIAAEPDLVALRPLLESTAQSLVASPALGPVVGLAVAPTFDVLDGGDGAMVLRLADVAALVVATVTTLSPAVHATLPPDLDVRLSDFAGQDHTNGVLHQVHVVDLLAWLAPLLGVLLLVTAGSVIPAPGRVRRAARYAGRGSVVAGGVLALALVVVGFLVGRTDDGTLSGALAQAVWGELSGAFWVAVGVLAVAGAAIALAARPGTDLAPRSLLRGATTWIVDPGPEPWPRVGRAVTLLLLGIALLLQPLAVVQIVLRVVGAALVLLALGALVTAVGDLVRGREDRTHHLPRILVGTVGVLALVTALLAGAWPGSDDLAGAVAVDGTACNGHDELCDRTYDEVAFPATHNSMSAADQPGWFFAEQPDGVISQLDHGVRVLLIDSWYGQETSRPGVVATSEGSRAAGIAEARESFGDAAVNSALRLRDATKLAPTGPVEPYLCHALCELGSTKWEPLMEQVRAWMDAHPREVVTLFVQDEVSPADTAEVVEDAGLLPYVYTPTADGSWPTLGSMIDSGHRLVVLMENHGGGTTYPWLLDGFQQVQDTPYLFEDPSEFSCDLNRGTPDLPVFLVNHWIDDKTATVTNAAQVNALDVLLPRLQECASERDRLPNYVAVDFYDQGDLFGAVDAMNGF
ncbi:hypothetical protein ABLE68_14210 [Nocardioides sp. CN2-186]|uniref:hypothetical protein n=1 Tax=Nocardioides tweenelious TaxID=3156607 RepID=UPI0032B47C63